jgi:nucleoside-diphosphate kinase
MSSGPVAAVVIEGERCIEGFRALAGATDPTAAAPGSIRGDLAVETAQNLVHASDSAETATSEIALWFDDDELLDYAREVDRWVLAPEE